jgi:hypothetical protein
LFLFYGCRRLLNRSRWLFYGHWKGFWLWLRSRFRLYFRFRLRLWLRLRFGFRSR